MSFPKRGKAKVLFFAMILLIGFTLFGCSDDTSTSVTNPNPNTLNPTGQIQGILLDAMTEYPIVGAVVDIGVGKATTNADGVFVINNVPATTDALNGTVTGSYSVTIDMKNVTSPVNMKDAATTPRYPDYSYDFVNVAYTSLKDTNSGGGDNSSNHDTPVTGLSATMNVSVGKLAAAINGIVAYAKDLRPVGSGWTVKLISLCSANTGTGACENVVGTTTTDADSKFSFSNIESLQNFRIEAWDSAQTYFAVAWPVTAPADNETETLTVQKDTALFAYLDDSKNPTIIDVTPENLADITPASTDVVFTFSEPIRQSAYTNTSPSANGMYYDVDVNWVGTKTGNIAHSISWNTDYTQLTVNIPTLSPSSIYSVDLCAATLTDDALHGVTNLCTTGEGVISFSTTGAASASAPTIAIVNPSAIDSNSAVELDWTAVTGAKKYNVYQADNQVWGGTTTPGTFRIVAQGVGTSSYTTPALSFVEGTEIKLTYDFKVKSVNSDNIESAESNTETAEDAVGPILTGAAATYRTDFSDSNNTITLSFNEYLDETTAETLTNYAWKDTAARDTQATPAAISITGPVYNPTAMTVTLTLSGTLDSTTLTQTYFINPTGTGATGVTPSLTAGDDTQSIAAGNGAPNTACVTEDAAGTAATAKVGDDVQVIAVAAVTTLGAVIVNSGPNGICDTTRVGTETQALVVGNGLANQPVTVKAGPNLMLNTPPGANTIVRASAIQVSNVTDVAGNVIKTTADVLNTDGTRQ